ncbi:hypothetical protein AC1031_006582 [Aphanomyces cochlioides]|nr:hypothetical protein AC1031_006582 [Aphanomyces cochlioides]
MNGVGFQRLCSHWLLAHFDEEDNQPCAYESRHMQSGRHMGSSSPVRRRRSSSLLLQQACLESPDGVTALEFHTCEMSVVSLFLKSKESKRIPETSVVQLSFLPARLKIASKCWQEGHDVACIVMQDG